MMNPVQVQEQGPGKDDVKDKEREEGQKERGEVIEMIRFACRKNPSCADFFVGSMLPTPAVDLRGESLYYSRLT
jgi:hypothetical protein